MFQLIPIDWHGCELLSERFEEIHCVMDVIFSSSPPACGRSVAGDGPQGRGYSTTRRSNCWTRQSIYDYDYDHEQHQEHEMKKRWNLALWIGFVCALAGF